MMNMLAIGLILTTIVTAGMWSPSPSPPPHHDEVIVKEGHRVVVVEYDKESDGSTKVLISPHDADPNDPSAGQDAEPAQGSIFSGPKELVCDAYGKCKHRLANTFGKTKDTVTETAHDVSDKAHEIEQQVEDAASGAIGKAKDAASGALGKAKKAGNDVGETKDKLSEKVSGNIVGETIGKAKDTVKKVADDVVSTVKDGASKAKHFDVLDSPKRMGEDIERNITGKIEEGVEQAKESVKKVGEKSLGEILSKLKEVSYDIFWYIMSRDILDSVVGLIHMLGFSTAYGMCVWVTFVSSYILGRYLPRTQFGMVQSRIYPVYFKAMAYCVSAALLGHLVSQRKEMRTNMMEMFQGLSLGSALLMVLTNMFLEPKATKLMYQRMKIEKEEGRGIAAATATKDRAGDNNGGGTATTAVRSETKDRVVDNNGGGTTTTVRSQTNVVSERQDVLRLNEKLKRLNTYSSALNVATLVVLTWHMAYMGQRLQATR